MSAFPLNRKPVEPEQSSRLSNEQIKLDLITSCVAKINQTKTDSISMDYKKLLIQLSPDIYYLENSGVTPLLVDALKHLDEIRPLDPIEFVAAYMILNKGLYDGNPMYEFSEDDPSDLIDNKLEI